MHSQFVCLYLMFFYLPYCLASVMTTQGLHMGAYSFIVLVALCSCRPVVGSSLLEWMGISSGPNANDKEITVKDGVPLLKVPFEEATPEDKFLREAEKLVGLKSSELDSCQHKVHLLHPLNLLEFFFTIFIW